jgi:hypothetical protein
VCVYALTMPSSASLRSASTTLTASSRDDAWQRHNTPNRHTPGPLITSPPPERPTSPEEHIKQVKGTGGYEPLIS